MAKEGKAANGVIVDGFGGEAKEQLKAIRKELSAVVTVLREIDQTIGKMTGIIQRTIITSK